MNVDELNEHGVRTVSFCFGAGREASYWRRHACAEDTLENDDGLRSDVVTGLKAVGDGFDYITDSESEHTAEREEQVRSLQSEVSALRNELAAARAEGMERTAKATIAGFTEIAAQRAAVDQLMEKEREKNAQTLLLAAGRDEHLRVLQDEVSALRAQLVAVRVEGA